MTWISALKRTAFLTGATALMETSRRALRRAIVRQRRARAMRRGRYVLKRVGIAAAFAGVAFLIRGVAMR